MSLSKAGGLLQGAISGEKNGFPVLKLTCVFLLTYPVYAGAGAAAVNAVIAVLCALMVFSDAAVQRTSLWLAVFACMALGLALQWYTMDNHKFLMAYWVLVCGLSLAEPDRESFLATGAARLLGLTFLFALAWKFLSGEYLNGAFAHARLLEDPRFAPVTSFLSGLDRAALHGNALALEALRREPGTGEVARVHSTARLQAAALGICWWTLVIEGAVAILFLGRWRWRRSPLPDLALLVFLSTTYLGAPVAGFGVLLAVLGFAQCDRSRPRLRTAYLVLFFLLHLTKLIPGLAAGS